MSKQDRQGVRTAAALEQKYQFGKTFAEIMGIANDARESVDSVASTLRSEMEQQATTLRRDTEKIIAEATKTLVKESDFERYKEDAKTEFKVYSDGISSTVSKTTEQVEILTDKMENIKDGKDAILLMIESSAGNLFKNSDIATTLTVTIIVGDTTITDSTRLLEVFGNTAKIKWQQMSMGETEFTDMDENDPRFSDNGFIFTLNAHDISTKAVFNCLLDY